MKSQFVKTFPFPVTFPRSTPAPLQLLLLFAQDPEDHRAREAGEAGRARSPWQPHRGGRKLERAVRAAGAEPCREPIKGS